MTKIPKSGGGWQAIRYALQMAQRSGGLLRFYRALRARNACKTCALGMGGQRGGMVDESGRFPEVCKKSMQAMAADMQGRIGRELFETYSIDQMRAMSPRELEAMGRLAEPMFAGPNDTHYRPVSWEWAMEWSAQRLIRTPSGSAAPSIRTPSGSAGPPAGGQSGADQPELPARGPVASAPGSDPVGIPDLRALNSAPRTSSAELGGSNSHVRTPDDHFFYFSGRSSNEAAFLLQLFARLYGTNNVNNCSYYCHQASGVGLRSAIGTATATVELDDLARCDLVFLIGGNPASNHPRLMRLLTQVRRRGGDVIVINPIREPGLVNFKVPSDWRSLVFGSPIASLYLQPHIGGDIALLTGIAKRIFEMDSYCAEAYAHFPFSAQRSGRGQQDMDMVRGCCDGYDEFKQYVESVSWDEIERVSGVDPAEIDRAADMYAASKATIFAWTMGITHHVHGVDNVRAIANLALLRGMVGKPGAGLLPIRGHSNVQGIGSVGVAPRLAPLVLERLESRFGVKLPTRPGLDTLACIEAMETGQLRHAWCIGGNLFGCSPDAQRTAAAFGRLDSVVYLSTTLNTGHAWGRARNTLILPVRARDEEAQPTTQESMFNYVRLSEGGPARLEGPRGEVEIVAELADRVLGSAGPIDWRRMSDHRSIRQVIAEIIPGFEAMRHIDDTRREFHIAGRILHQPRFPTATGRAKLHAVAIPPEPDFNGGLSAATVSENGEPPGPTDENNGEQRPSAASRQSPQRDPAARSLNLRLMTLRSEGQFNTVVYEDEDIYRGQERRDVILLSEWDMDRLGVKADDAVTVRSAAGRMQAILVRPFAIRPGNAAMYFPEANILVPRAADPESRTPAFKSVAIQVTPEKEPGGPRLPVLGRIDRGAPRKQLPAC